MIYENEYEGDVYNYRIEFEFTGMVVRYMSDRSDDYSGVECEIRVVITSEDTMNGYVLRRYEGIGEALESLRGGLKDAVKGWYKLDVSRYCESHWIDGDEDDV